jgi:universal stress protein A
MPFPYQRLLVCLDLSSAAGTVLARARELVHTQPERMIILHVVEHRPLPDLDYGLGTLPGLEPDLDSVLAAARSRLDALLGDSPEITREVVAGIPHGEIIRMAELIKADLIVLGSGTRSGLGRLLGSTAHSVLTHAPCDVLAVRMANVAKQA